MNFSRPVATIIITVLVIVGGFFFLLRGCLAKYDERSALPPILYFEKDGKSVVFSIVQFEKATSYSRQGGFVRKSVSTNYFIQSNDAVTGEKLNDKKIKHHRDIKSHPVRILGGSGNNAWVFMGEVMAFDPFTLDKIADVEILEQKNPSVKGKLPAEEKYYQFNRSDNNIYFTALDGSAWKLDTKTLAVTETGTDAGFSAEENEVKQLDKLVRLNLQQQDTLMEQKLRRPGRMLQAKEISMSQYQEMIKGFNEERTQLYRVRDSLRDLQSKMEKRKRTGDDVKRKIESLTERSTIHFSQIKTNQDTTNGKWYGLYTEKELDKLYNRVQYQAVYEETARRKLISSTYSPDPYGDFLIDKDNATPLSSPPFLDGGFLLDKHTGMPVHLGNSSSFIVVFKNQVGNEGKIQVSRLDINGKQSWAFDSELKEWADYLYTGQKLFILGTDNKELSSNHCNVLWLLDLESGKASRYDFFRDK